MAAEFSLDLSKFKRAIKELPAQVGRGAQRGLGDIKDDWVRESRDIAPLDKRNLRDQIHGEVVNPGISGVVEVHSNATQDTGGKRFNYAYYIHEQNAGGRSLKLSGAKKKYLDESAKANQAKWQRWMEEEITSEIKKAGW